MMKFIENNKFLNEMENFMDLARVVSLGLGPAFMIFSHYDTCTKYLFLPS